MSKISAEHGLWACVRVWRESFWPSLFTVPFLFLLALAGFIMFHGPARAGDTTGIQAGDLVISHPWLRMPPQGAAVAGGFVAIQNTGQTEDRLMSVSTDISAQVQLHTMVMKGDVMQMAELPDGIPIPAGQTITLRPGELHMMFIGLKHPLQPGSSFSGTLTFAKAGTVNVQFLVEAPGGMQQ